MPRLKLTDAAARRIRPPSAGSEIYWDTLTTGLGLRVTYGGTKSFIVQARVLKEGRWIDQKRKLGRYPAQSLASARQAAKTELEAAQTGKQMGDTRVNREMAQVEQSKNTFGYVRDEFLKRYRTRQKKKPSPRTLDELKRVLNHTVFSEWDDKSLTEITRRDVMDAIDAFISKGHETAANRYLTYIKMMFQWAMDRAIIKEDPTDRIKPPGAEHSRERVLTLDEMRAIWTATEPTQQNKGDLFACIVKVLLLSGQRRNEVAGMQWSEIDLDSAMWSLPGSRTKNKRDHFVPLAEPVLDILCERQQEQADMRMKTDLVFTSTGTAPFSGWSRSKARLDGRAGIAHWTIHDLRRTLVTRMSEDLHIAPHLLESIVNHVSGVKAGVAGVYNRALYLDERRKALEAWADYVSRIVGDIGADNVVRLAERKQ